MTNEEEIVFNEYVELIGCPENVAASLHAFCARVKEARPEAELYHTNAQLIFRVPNVRNGGNGIEIRARRTQYRIALRKVTDPTLPQGNPVGPERWLVRYEYFIVLEPDRYHPEVTDKAYEDLVFKAALNSYDQAVKGQAGN